MQLGYTPKNLADLLHEGGLNQVQARQIIGKGRNTFSRYLKDANHPDHASMSHRNWLTLVSAVQEKIKNDIRNR